MRRPLCILALFLLCLSFLRLTPSLVDKEGKEGEGWLELSGRVVDKEYAISYGEESWQVTLDRVKVMEGAFEPEGKKVICTLNKAVQEPVMGQYLRITGELTVWEEAANPGQFDFGNWYLAKGIGGRLRKAEILMVEGEGSPFQEGLWEARRWAMDMLKDSLGEEDGALMGAMVVGDRSGIPEDTNILYQRNGISHILSISGLHLMLLGMGVYTSFGKLPLPIPIAALGSMGVMSVYCLFTGSGVSTLRATIMFCILLCSKVVGRSYDSLSALGLAAAIQLFLNPGVLLDSGFQLSYLAVLGVSAVVPRLKLLFITRNKLVESSIISLGIGLTTVPVLLYHFGTYPWHSIVLNLLVVPTMSLLLWLAIILLALSALFSPTFFLCQLLTVLIKAILYYYELCCKVFDNLPVWSGYQGRPMWICIILYYLFLFVLLWILPKKERLSRKKRLLWLVGLFVCIQVLNLKNSVELEITMLDVGQGDGIVMKTESEHVYIFDFGSSSVNQPGTYRLLPFLKTKGYGKVEGIFISHLDQDHYNGILELLEQADREHIQINRLYLPISLKGETDEETKEKLRELLQLARVTEVSVVFLGRGDSVTDGKTRFFCLHPHEREKGRVYESNDESLVLTLEYGDFSMLLTGDVENQGEEEIRYNFDWLGQFDVLKVAHHGSRGSSSARFLSFVRPKVSLISCGKNNSYGHPSEEVVERLKQGGSLVLITTQTGAITIQAKANGSFMIETFHEIFCG